MIKLQNLAKAAIGLLVETPAAIVADVVTLGGETTGNGSYTADALENVFENIKSVSRDDDDERAR